jgi:hypothetical protein
MHCHAQCCCLGHWHHGHSNLTQHVELKQQFTCNLQQNVQTILSLKILIPTSLSLIKFFCRTTVLCQKTFLYIHNLFFTLNLWQGIPVYVKTSESRIARESAKEFQNSMKEDQGEIQLWNCPDC